MGRHAKPSSQILNVQFLGSLQSCEHPLGALLLATRSGAGVVLGGGLLASEAHVVNVQSSTREYQSFTPSPLSHHEANDGALRLD